VDKPEKYRNLIGQEIDVTIDRPIGSRHPRFDTLYETNYGCIEDTLAGDGMEIDAYVLGLEIPVKTFRGKCIAIIFRLNDVEHKIVVSNDYLSVREIQVRTDFIERYFKTNIVLCDI